MSPPLAVKLVLPPAHIVVVPAINAVGRAFTVTVELAVFVHPLPSVTVTVYAVVADGDTVIDAVVSFVLHEYDVPPLAVSIVLPPAQISVVPVMAAVGKAFTVTVAELMFVQPLAEVTVTV